ncbi:hypothetical protein INS49_002623 [Diaporthe citri]|uniref:uncharacterized protein n=1 Tax=Diaporthe citri TaxID=83186 RepID=UPI001C8039D0|nr:uncharacterized protein INS49_002623 [Diaporthe citri]KAG6368416.1 hypothetical protein INS49_002623 [Diaporthe citri]
MQSQYNTVPMYPLGITTVNISNETVQFDQHGYFAYLLANASGNPPALSTVFEDPEGAKSFFSNYFQQYTALLAHTSLMQPVSTLSEGTAVEVVNRFLALVLVGITIALEVTLRISNRNDGLADVPSENQYISYLWTTLPTVIFTLISMYCSSVDFDTRALAPSLHLVQGSSFESSVGLDLINKHPLLLFYEELRSRSFEAMASTLAVTLTSFLTIFSAGLFSGVYVATKISTQLHVADFVWYGVSGASSNTFYPDYSLVTAALILNCNLTYPPFTYEHLIIPNMTVDQGFLRRHPDSSNVEFSVTLPAVRPSFANCRLYDSSQIRIDFASAPQAGPVVVIEPEQCIENGTTKSWNLRVYRYGPVPSPLPSHAYFGVGSASDRYARGCSERLWAWGHWIPGVENGSSPKVMSVSALGCNESMEIVDVSVPLFGSDLAINPKFPPIANESSTSAVVIQWGSPLGFDFYPSLPGLSTNMTDRVFDKFFTLLTTSRYAVPFDMISNGSQASAVAEAVQFHHCVLVAQMTAAIRGLNFYHNDTVLRSYGYEIVPGTNRTSSYNVTGSIPSSRHRVVQGSLSTRFLQGLLIPALMCCLANWYLIRSAGGCQMIPRKPTTIANVAALLADSDIIELLPPENTDVTASKETRKEYGRLEDCIFRLGWRELDGHPEQVYSICVSSTK